MKIQSAVEYTHKATILVTELLNIHIRRCLKDNIECDLSNVLNSNWIMNAYNEVTIGKRKTKVDDALHCTKETFMPTFNPPQRQGLTQCMLYEAQNLATVATTNVWMQELAHVFLTPEHY